MSQTIKYISSKHYGAPVIKGDSWGYLVNMLKVVLSQGFNSCSPTSYNILSANTFQLNYINPHNYSLYQILNTAGFANGLLNTECEVIAIPSSTTLTLKTSNDLTPYIGATGTVSGATSIVAPLGMNIKYSSGNKAVFTCENPTEECYFYIDDTQPTNWTSGKTICPLVFITDNMSDINTVTGKRILPYSKTYTSAYKTKDWVYNTFNKTGLWHWPSFLIKTNSSSNSAGDQATSLEWHIIGNGRFFWYIVPQSNSYNGSSYFIGHFGKFYSTLNAKNYALGANSCSSDVSDNNDYEVGSFYDRKAITFNNYTAQINKFPVDIGSYSNGLLSDYKGMLPTSCIYYPASGAVGNSNSINFISGQSSLHRVNPISNTIDLSSINIYDNSVKRGLLPGCLFINSADPGFFNCSLNIMNDGTNIKKMFYFVGAVNSGTSNVSFSSQALLISLDYNDWKNYN